MHLGRNRRWVPLITVELNLAVIALKRPKIQKFISTIADNTTKDYEELESEWSYKNQNSNNRGKIL